MNIDKRLAALTVLNDAIRTLDFDCLGPLASDDLVTQATELLMEAREMHTDKSWPELRLPTRDAAAYEAWMAARIAEQMADGRQ